MRSRPTALARGIPVILVLIAAQALAAERVEKILTDEGGLPEGTRLSLDNLVGSIQVLPAASGRNLRVEARVVAEAGSRDEAEALAGEVRLSRETRDGVVNVHVGFPVESRTAFRLPRSEKDGLLSKWVTPFLRKSTVATTYDERTVEVGESRGAAAVAVHVKVTVPMDIEAHLKQVYGSIRCSGFRGRLVLEIVEGEALAEQIYGSLQARTGGGGLRVWRFNGDALEFQTGSGRIELIDVNARELRLSSDAGSIEGQAVKADSLVVASGKGDVKLDDVEAAAFDVETVSGDVDLAAPLTRTREGAIRSQSGDVTLRIGRLAPLRLLASSKSGKVNTKGCALEVLEQNDEGTLLGRRSGGTDLRISTAKGEVTVRPI